MKNWKLIAGVLVCLLVTTVLITTVNGEDKPYNQVELSLDNGVFNNTDFQYYDTALSVGLEQAGIKGINVTVSPLSDRAKAQFDGSLKAHIRYWEGHYYLFIADLDRTEAIEVISHEIVHIQQYQSGELTYDNQTGDVVWKDRLYTLETNYDDRPWEQDAFSKQSDLIGRVTNILY